MNKKITDNIKNLLSMERIKNLCLDIYSKERTFCYSDFRQSAEYCFEKLKENNLSEVKLIELPADGTTTYMDCTMPEAWDIEDADLTVFYPDGKEEILTQYKDDIFCVANRCAPTSPDGIVGKVVSYEAMMKGENAKGKFVFSQFTAPLKVRWEACKRDAAGIISSYSPAALESADSTFWINGWCLPGWYHTKSDKKMVCFSLPPRKGAHLANLINEANIKVRARVKSKIHDGSIFTVTGTIPGKSKKEIILLAHLYEPFITDDAVGAAALIEISRILNTLISEKKIGVPDKTIRVLMSMELYGFSEFFQKESNRNNALLAINMDDISFDIKKSKEPLKLRISPSSMPFWGDSLFVDIAASQLKDYPMEIEKGNLSDDTFMSDRTIGIPSLWLYTHPGVFHHNSIDQFDRLVDWDLAQKVIISVSTYISLLAITAGVDDIQRLTQRFIRDVKIEIINKSKLLAEKKDYNRIIDEFNFVIRVQKEKIKSLKKFWNGICINDIIRQIDKIAEEEKQNLLSLSGRNNKIKKLTPKEKTAWNIIVTRKDIGFPFSLAKVPVPEKRLHPDGVHQILNWCDGNCDLLEALKFYYFDTGVEISSKFISDIISYLSFLEKYGYIKIDYKTTLTQNYTIETSKKMKNETLI